MADRRPLQTRSNAFALKLAAALIRTNISPNQISILSIIVAAAGAAALLYPSWPMLLLAALCTQLRLLCNMLDGMVAVEGGKASPTGALYNEVPDRIADSLLLIALGYAVALPELGWLAALLAAITAYIRVLGGSLGLAQDFRGPMAKPHRMAVLTLGCLLGAAEWAFFGTRWALWIALMVILLGSVWTCIARLGAISSQLKSR